jgi:hypothetical protein
VDATVTVDVKGKMEQQTTIYVSVANGAKELDETEKAKYISQRWSTT